MLITLRTLFSSGHDWAVAAAVLSELEMSNRYDTWDFFGDCCQTPEWLFFGTFIRNIGPMMFQRSKSLRSLLALSGPSNAQLQ